MSTSYTADFKVKAVLESFQRDTSPVHVCQQLGVSRAQLYRWRREFKTQVTRLLQGHGTSQGDTYAADFKVQVVLESFQRDRNAEDVAQLFHISQDQLTCWRREFEQNVVMLFQKKRAKRRRSRPGETREDLKKRIRDLTIQIDILKKAWGLLGN